MKKLKFLALPLALIAMLGFVACSSDDDSDDGDSVNTNPSALYNTTWLYEENGSDSEKCTNTHYSSSSSDDNDESKYTKSKTKSESKSKANTETVSTYYLRTEKDGTAYFGNASFSRTTTTTYDEVTYTYTNKTSGSTFTETEKENKKTTTSDGAKTYTPLYKGSLAVDSTNATATYTFESAYSSDEWSDSSNFDNAMYAKYAKLYESSQKPYALSVKVQGSTLKLIYKTATNTCGLKLDASGTKCTTLIKTEYYGKWSKIDYDSTMIGKSSSSTDTSTYTMAQLAGTWSGTYEKGYSDTLILKANGTGTDYEGGTSSSPVSITWTLSGNTVTIIEPDGTVAVGTLTSATTMTMSVTNQWIGTLSGTATKTSDSTDSSSSSTTSTGFDYVTTDTSNPLGAALAKLSAGATLADGTYGEVTVGQYKETIPYYGTITKGGTSASSRSSDGQYLRLAANTDTSFDAKSSGNGGIFSIKVEKGAKVSITAKASKDYAGYVTQANLQCNFMYGNHTRANVAYFSSTSSTASFEEAANNAGVFYFYVGGERPIDVSEIKVEY